MKIGIDFDRVLFDTDSFKEELETMFSGFGQKYEEACNPNYDFNKHAELLSVSKQDILAELENTKNFLYNDAKVLAKLWEKHEVVIVSRGNPVFQEKKIQSSGVLEFVHGYVIVQEEAKDVVDIDFLVDDRVEELERTDIKGMLFKRGTHTLEDVINRVKELES